MRKFSFCLLLWMDLCTSGCRFMQMNAYFLVMNSKRCNSHKLFFWWCMDIVRRKLMLVTIATYSKICCILLCIFFFGGFCVPSIILADLLGNTYLLADWWISICFVCFLLQGLLLSDRTSCSQIFIVFLILVTCKNKAMSASFLWQKIHSPLQFPSLFLSSQSHSQPSWANMLHCDLL